MYRSCSSLPFHAKKVLHTHTTTSSAWVAFKRATNLPIKKALGILKFAGKNQISFGLLAASSQATAAHFFRDFLTLLLNNKSRGSP